MLRSCSISSGTVVLKAHSWTLVAFHRSLDCFILRTILFFFSFLPGECSIHLTKKKITCNKQTETETKAKAKAKAKLIQNTNTTAMKFTTTSSLISFCLLAGSTTSAFSPVTPRMPFTFTTGTKVTNVGGLEKLQQQQRAPNSPFTTTSSCGGSSSTHLSMAVRIS